MAGGQDLLHISVTATVDIKDRSDCINIGKLASDNQWQVGRRLSSHLA